MYCVPCGTEARPLDKFCPGCGEKQSEATPVPYVSAEPQAPTQPQDIPAIRETPPSRSNVALIGSITLILLLILGVVGYRMSQPQPAFVSEGVTTTTSEVATTATSEVAPPTTTNDVATTTAELILATAQVVARMTSVDYASRLMDWTRLENLFPSRSWSDLQDPDFPFARSAEVAEGLTVYAKGARTIISQTIIAYRYYNPDFYNPSAEGRRLDLLSEFESALTPTILRCESDNPWLGERWYRVSIEGMEPLSAKHEGSGGSGGGSEWLTFGRMESPPVGMELPPLGTEAFRGTWTDECSG